MKVKFIQSEENGELLKHHQSLLSSNGSGINQAKEYLQNNESELRRLIGWDTKANTALIMGKIVVETFIQNSYFWGFYNAALTLYNEKLYQTRPVVHH